MKCRSVAAALALLLLAGCGRDVANAPGALDDDAQRLDTIDSRFNQGDYDYAVAAAQLYVAEYPRSFRGWSLLGWVYVKTDELDKAAECFDKSLEINPQWDNAYVGRGAMYRKSGDNASARRSYLEAIRVLPDNPEAFSSLLVIELLEGNDQQAVEYGERAWALRKDHAGIPANLSVAYHYLGNTAQRDLYFQHAQRLGYHRLQVIQDVFDGKIAIGDR